MTGATNVGARRINAGSVQYNGVRREGSVALGRERVNTRNNAGTTVVVRKRVKASPFPVSFVFYAVVMMVMLTFIIYNNSVLNEISYEVSEVKNQIAIEEQKIEKLDIELEKKYDLKEIERIATTELGLVKSSEVATHYVSVSGGDKVVVSETDGGAADSLGVSLNSFKKSVAKIYE